MEKINRCEHCKYNAKVLDMLKNRLPDNDTIENLSEVFKVFGDATRLKIMWVLFDNEKCVFDISEALKMSQSAISHQLKVLKDARLVRSRREGKNTFYSLDDEHVERIIEQVLIHNDEHSGEGI